MKRVVIAFSFLMILMSSFAQSTEHLKFKGVPIDGTLNERSDKSDMQQ